MATALALRSPHRAGCPSWFPSVSGRTGALGRPVTDLPRPAGLTSRRMFFPDRSTGCPSSMAGSQLTLVGFREPASRAVMPA
jgi:hypothetical protein